MNRHAGDSRSIWTLSPRIPERAPLGEDTTVDVCVVGAGIAGLSTAWLLQEEGRDVVVLDDGPIAGGETERTTAHLSSALDTRYVDLESLHGEAGARLAAESHAAAIDRIEAIVVAQGIACGFERVDGHLFLPPGGDPVTLDAELQALHRAGLTDVGKLKRAPISGFDTGPSLRFPNQAQLHPLRYVDGLARAFEARGGRICCGTRVTAIEDGSPARVTTESGHWVRASAVVVATNTPINDRFAIHTKQAPYRTYVIAARVPRGAAERALYWDTGADSSAGSAFHYVRLAGASGETGSELLIAGGGDHKTGQEHDDAARFGLLELWTRERFRIGEVTSRWSGQVMQSIDGLAFLGKNPGDENVFVATGDSGSGMTHGTIAGLLLTDLIQGRDNPWAKLYDPSRVNLHAAASFAREIVNVAAQYVDWVTPGEKGSVDELRAGEGAIVRDGATKVAAYRDEKLRVHLLSAVCTHLGGLVSWNAFEKTWDCPCHGSRFDVFGHVVNGPANQDLAPVVLDRPGQTR